MFLSNTTVHGCYLHPTLSHVSTVKCHHQASTSYILQLLGTADMYLMTVAIMEHDAKMCDVQ